MSAAQTPTGSIAANTVQKWLRAWYSTDMPDAIDLEIVRQMLPSTPYGTGAREIKAPMVLDVDSCEGMLVRNPKDAAEWGIFYNGKASPERRRFTIAHELGHFILHRGQQQSFNCDKESVYSGVDTIRAIEREADDFASNLLMPGDLLRDWISSQRIDLHVLSAIAKRFQVSFEALCIRFIKFTTQRAILIYWDNGYVKYEWRSSSAIKTRARIRRNDDPAEPLPGTLGAAVPRRAATHHAAADRAGATARARAGHRLARGRLDRIRCRHRRASVGRGIQRTGQGSTGMSTETNPRKRTVRIEVGADARSYVSDGQRVTLVPLTIKRRQNRKLLIPPALDAATATGGFDVPMIKTLGKAFYWKRLIDEGVYTTTADLARALKLEPGWAAEVLRMTMLAPDIVEAIFEGRQPRHLNLHTLRGRQDLLPRDWAEQRRLLGFPDA
ncbi:ImmA/IrrE family metallo-endopeptidase [Burkholderia multivorans]|uniref:ImmA/IrrE family metallo-endopeptidase n=3 Tax=Burkholderia cepacia complex TaxID=87882 RepID=UPI003BAC69C2